ncbi:tubulin polyglutamylase complex subunit 2-like isoform X2 [Centruroides sculpturatus]|uniref:tubulin polyglutamylase complex subunit 2-like isoform X2 n=1 Tax=Centruroides sculpturatus TaxID=218467 RepID=UPI000C6DCFB1|nr:tubulin polyglutamylase complex subunit 2-like isoform X2 [Centruroides sculpturatus]
MSERAAGLLDLFSFVDNVTLGVAKYLEHLPTVQAVTVMEKEPVDASALASWEQRHNCCLPDDAKSFYSATDGLQLKWNVKTKDESMPGGALEINSLAKLRRITPKQNCLHSELPTLVDLESDSDADDKECDGGIPSKPKFKNKCKAFLLDPCQGSGKVCLVYPGKVENAATPSVWFLDRALEWHYLSPDFSSYLRLALVHLGIPHWQYVFTPWGPPPKTKQILSAFVSERLAMDQMAHSTIGGVKLPPV